MANQQSSEYQVTARKWRPTEFESVVGQEHITQTIRNAMKSDRVHHAYLFCGPRGVGKTTTARILAKALNCTDLSPEFEPCGQCESCRAITEGRSLDVIEIDGASNNSVEDVRKLRDSARYPPVAGARKLYIIDEVHMLSTSAFNALLKTLEEPPKHLVFVFATTEPHKVPATILSRCQRFDFRRMQIADIVGRLAYIAGQENIVIDEDALTVIAKKADGSMRDSHSIFDQVVAFCGTTVTYAQVNDALNIIDQEFFFRVTDMMRAHQTSEAFDIVRQVMFTGYDAQEFLIGLAEHLRNFLTVITTGGAELIEAARAHRLRYSAEAASFTQGDVVRALHIVLAAQQAIRTSSQPRLRLELTLVQLAVMDSTVLLTQLLEKIDRMAGDGGGGQGDPSAAAGVPAAAVQQSSGQKTPQAQSTAPAPEALPENPPSPPQPVAPAVHAPRPTVNVSGSVKRLAEFPTGRQDSSAADPQSAASPAAAVAAAGQPVADVPGGGQNLALHGQVQDRWMDFVLQCGGALGVLLQSARVSDVTGDTLRVVTDQTNAPLLKKQARSLGVKLSQFFDTPLQVQIAVASAAAAVVNDQDRQDTSPAVSSANGLPDHPFIQGIVDQLGASPI